jgi:hypothetical protein
LRIYRWHESANEQNQYTRFTALRLGKLDGKLGTVRRFQKGSDSYMTPILIALVSVLPLAVAGLSLLFVSRNPPHNPHRHAINLWDLK